MSAAALPEYWRSFRPRQPRPPVDWRAIRVITAMAVAGASLIVSGLTQNAFGAAWLGWGMMGAGVVVFVAASQVEW